MLFVNCVILLSHIGGLLIIDTSILTSLCKTNDCPKVHHVHGCHWLPRLPCPLIPPKDLRIAALTSKICILQLVISRHTSPSRPDEDLPHPEQESVSDPNQHKDDQMVL